MKRPPDDGAETTSSASGDDVLRRFAPHPYQSLDAAGRIRVVNDAWLDRLGYEREAVVGEPFADVLAPESKAAAEAHFEAFKREGQISDVEFELRRADGETIAVAFDGVIEYDEEGAFRRTHCQFTEITDRRDRRAALERTNTVLTTLLENLPFGVLIEDSDREIIGVNDALVEILGGPVAAEDLLGEDCAQAAEEVKDRFERPDAFIDRTETLLERREPVLNETLELANGDVVERSYVPYTLPEGDANFWIYRDVSDRVERERALESLHHSTRDLLDADDRTDLAERTVAAAKETLGYPISVVRLRSKERAILEPVAVTDEARSMLGERPAYPVGEGTAGTAYERGESLVIDDLEEWDDGYDRNRVRSAMYLPIGEYGVLGIGDAAVDAFDRSDVQLASILAMNAEAALRRMDRERDLHYQNERLEEFASIVSHDLRSPLNVASGRLELVREDCDSDHLDHVAAALSRMEEITENTLTLARQGKTVGETEPVAADALVEECWTMVDTGAATLAVDDAFTLEADPDRVRQLFENLFRNAVEHAGESVTVRIGRLGDHGFYVEDDGPGIPAEDRESVFEAGVSGSTDGTGFGLAIVRRIAEAHGWDVDVTDSESGGARFEFSGVEVD
ncbi:Signal transduction histidine kinase [Halanaeroarchaeum sp. HSR-CO]|uniref:PAS domain-containing sensor histidine kinase n=1 Tax=Halanaeroarchaeum sp. HSR-CO TaxID=2866382 RepID=UPI00217DFC65|nr:ATP-binding protein [Halanaeroarchaeum sp. HSR-CO]UWG46513.1 Signal transduction histidine kinase [Halanaeroarchaeum sp. HSR-CO]